MDSGITSEIELFKLEGDYDGQVCCERCGKVIDDGYSFTVQKLIIEVAKHIEECPL